MNRFPTDKHLASWAGMCPGNNESAGKRHNGKTRKGNKHLRASLTRAGTAAGRQKDTALGALSQRVTGRRGAKRAHVAVGHAILVIAYHIISKRVPYQELGGGYSSERERMREINRTLKQLQKLGYQMPGTAA